MTHEMVHDRLSAYLDGELELHERQLVDAHLVECHGCRTLLSDLRTIAATAALLPGRDLGGVRSDADDWAPIVERLGPPSEGVVPFARRAASRRVSFSLPQLAAAGIILMLLSGGAVYLAFHPRTPAGPASVMVEAPPSAGVAPVSLADPQFDDAIADLEAALAAGRSRLDADTVRVLEQNLRAIDNAIRECREALAADPANTYLNSHLASARQRKLALLRRAAALTEGS